MSHDLSKMTSTLMSPQPECVFIIFFVSFIQMFRIQQMLFSKPALLFLCVFLKHQGTGGGGWGGPSRRGGSTCCPELLLRLMSVFLAEAAFCPAQASHCLPISSCPAQPSPASQCKRHSQWPFVLAEKRSGARAGTECLSLQCSCQKGGVCWSR